MFEYIGTILPWSVNYAPPGWHFCDGTLLSVCNFASLFSLIGTQYGGDGVNNFALPDLRGRSPIGTNSGPYEPKIELGESRGAYYQTIDLSEANLPVHNHGLETASIGKRRVSSSLYAYSEDGNHAVPQNGDYLGAGSEVSGEYSYTYRGTLDEPITLSGVKGSIERTEKSISGTLGKNGVKQKMKLDRTQPSLVINYIIAYEGAYPPKPK